MIDEMEQTTTMDATDAAPTSDENNYAVEHEKFIEMIKSTVRETIAENESGLASRVESLESSFSAANSRLTVIESAPRAESIADEITETVRRIEQIIFGA